MDKVPKPTPVAPPPFIMENNQGRSHANFNRLCRLMQKQYERTTEQAGRISFQVKLWDGPSHTFGDEEPGFTIVLSDDLALSALSTFDQNTVVEAYLNGSIQLEGNIMQVLALRELFNDNKGAKFLWRFIQPLLFGQVSSDKKWISNHYDTDADFFLLFLDTKYRAYSQAVFLQDDEPLEDAQLRKFDFALEAVKAKPGQQVLDIGSGWGAFVSYAGNKGVNVTSLTISAKSKEFVDRLITQGQLPCKVLQEHFFEHDPGHKYDAIVNCGVTEHLPDYRASLKHYEKLLKPGGYIYLDASAERIKNGQGTFMSRYVFQGNASLLCLHEFLAETAKSRFELIGVWNDRHNYYLTTREWAQRLDNNREEIERKWGKKLYRIFQLYLWGSAEGFHSGMIDAYRVVLRLPEV